MDSNAADEIKQMLGGFTGSIGRPEEGQKELRSDVAGLSGKVVESMGTIEARFEKDAAEIKTPHEELAHLTKVVEQLQVSPSAHAEKQGRRAEHRHNAPDPLTRICLTARLCN